MRRKMSRGPRGIPSGLDWRPWAFAVGIVVLVLWGVVSGSEPFRRGLHAARDTVGKSREYERIVAENKRAEAELEFLTTREGEAYAIRNDLGYIGKDEHVADVVVENGPATGIKLGQRVRSWLAGGMTGLLQRARDTRDVICCLLGLLEPVMPEEDTATPAPVQ